MTATTYNPRIFIRGLNTNKLLVEGDQENGESPSDIPANYVALEGDEGGVVLLEGDEA